MAKKSDGEVAGQGAGGDDLPREITPGGSEVIRHELGGQDQRSDVVYLSEEEMSAVEAHIEACLGPVDKVIHEIVSEGVHVDLVPIAIEVAGESFVALFTMGMSAVPMHLPDFDDLPEEERPSAFAELLMILPGRWDAITEEKSGVEEWGWWPVGILKDCARLPVFYDSWLGPGHTVPNGDPPEPYHASCPFAGVMVLPAAMFEGLSRMQAGGKVVDFYLLLPMFPAEIEYKLGHGAAALLEKMEEAGISPLDYADPERPSCVG